MRWRFADCCLVAILTTVAGGADDNDPTMVWSRLAAPLSTIVEVPDIPAGGFVAVEALVEVPPDAPADLGVGAFASDFSGIWYQRLHPRVLGPGRHHLRFDLDPAAPVAGEAHRGDWSTIAAATIKRAGLFFWSAQYGGGIGVSGLRLVPRATPDPAPTAPPQLLELDWIDHDAAAGVSRGRTGQRWELTCLPHPFPDNPYDPADFSLAAEIVQPDGTTLTVPGFYAIPQELTDRGDQEASVQSGPGRFHVRFRPRQPGRHRLVLVAGWRQGTEIPDAGATADPGTTRRFPLPDLEVAGGPWDDFVRRDTADPRFFSSGVAGATRLFWPVGLNIRSVNDPRGAQCIGSQLTPDRGSLAYEAFFRRLAAAGANAAEVWMSSWNLALEWRADWPGFHGRGRFHQGNAARLDRLLDLAGSLGLRINLVINNHGMASSKCDREWHNNPYNRELGGTLDHAGEFFTHPDALAGQERLRRYLVARYADHPAILGWKLWTEINLTQGERGAVVDWHQQACRRWHELDVYDHPCTTHWSGDYRTPDRTLVRLPELDYVCIDAYHGGGRDLLTQLLWDSTCHEFVGLHHTGVGLPAAKAVLVTEFGGNWDAGSPAQILAEHQSAAWAALISGHAGAPMLWWFEWVDQHDYWSPYGAIAGFLAGEDLRGNTTSPTRPARLTTTTPEIWCGAWTRPGRILGYCQDRAWGMAGGAAALHEGISIAISRNDATSGGRIRLEWWDPDTGRRLAADTIQHPGGWLSITAPPFRRHLAFKLWREPAP